MGPDLARAFAVDGPTGRLECVSAVKDAITLSVESRDPIDGFAVESPSGATRAVVTFRYLPEQAGGSKRGEI